MCDQVKMTIAQCRRLIIEKTYFSQFCNTIEKSNKLINIYSIQHRKYEKIESIHFSKLIKKTTPYKTNNRNPLILELSRSDRVSLQQTHRNHKENDSIRTQNYSESIWTHFKF